ncbi:MAG TPA: TRAP transporter small permease [Acidiferrobacterales bacterium]|nr:TRAP transporter small permease [Acidiferrobacterales bacterium]
MLLRRLGSALAALNTGMGYIAALLVVLAATGITAGIIIRTTTGIPTDWEIPLSVLALIAATFLSAGYTQIKRNHVSIEVLEHVLPARANHWRFVIGDLLSFVFCAFVAGNAWQLTHHAWIEGHRLDGAFDPKLWPVYALMAFGMTTLSLQLLVQFIANLRNPKATGIAEQEPEIAKWSE